jgi:sec-independent protein translocase protein TatA
MNIIFAGMLGGWEIVLILAVVLILFGAKRIPELAKGLGSGIREFKKAAREVTDEVNNAADEPAKTTQTAQAPKPTPPPQTIAQSSSSEPKA